MGGDEEEEDSLGGFVHILHAEEGVVCVGGAHDARGKHDGQGRGRHPVVHLLLRHSRERVRHTSSRDADDLQ